MPGLAANGGIVPDPVYGDQLQPQAILGVPPEGRATIRYFEEPITHADGSSETLRRPEYGIVDLAYGSLSDSIQVSPRVAPFLIGLGLLAAVDDASLLALADPADLDNDGISGRPNRVWDVQEQKTVIGRFGWKANQPTLAQQNAGAFLGDIGITSELFQEQNCTPIQAACQAAPNGGTPEIDAGKLAFITFYTHTLAVPARRNVDAPVVQKGEALFAGSGCSHCHLPELTTGELAGFPELSRQLIHPYTDLLLHDMGVGLADGRPDFEADGQEWRTPPLWGIGLVHTVNGHSMFLHDGRARNLAEAILWHGGEAAPSRDAYRQLSSSDRDALLRFLESL